MTTRHFCTYFDVNYLPRARALHESLARHVGDFRLYALCHDEAAYDAVTALGDSTFVAVNVAEVEAHDPELAAVKGARNRVEYYFTCTASFCRYVLDRFGDVDLVTYLDADLYFFSSPGPVYAELEGHSVGIIEHRFNPRVTSYGRFGRFNVGWVSFRRDADGLACLDWWRERCLEWCYDRVEADRYADQKYLDAFPERFAGVRIIEHPGANVAPWNAANHRFSVRNGSLDGSPGTGVGRGPSHPEVVVDGVPLIFFHFAAFKEVRPWLYRTDFGAYFTVLGSTLRRHVMRPYIGALKRFSTASTSAGRIRNTDSRLGAIARWPKTLARALRRVAFLEYVVYREPSA